MNFFRRVLDFLASSAPTRDMPGPVQVRDEPAQEEWVVTPATGWTSVPLLMLRVPKFRISEQRSEPARHKTAAAFCTERRMLHRVDTDA